MTTAKQGYVVAIHVPLFTNDGRLSDPEVLKNVKRRFSQLFGGYSTVQVVGGWVFQEEDPSGTYQKGELVEEYMDRVWSFAETLPVSTRAILKKLCQTVAKELAQEAVYFEISRADVKFVGA